MRIFLPVTVFVLGLATLGFAQGRGSGMGGRMGKGTHSGMGPGSMRGRMGRMGGGANGSMARGTNNGRSEGLDRTTQRNRAHDRNRQHKKGSGTAGSQQ